jgi:hypothetical protein
LAPVQLPEAPQFVLLVSGSMHVPPQLISVEGQHIPFEQDWPDEHGTHSTHEPS